MTISKTRFLAAVFLVLPISFFYWKELVDQMGGSILKAILVVTMALACGITDINDMAGQPEDHDD